MRESDCRNLTLCRRAFAAHLARLKVPAQFELTRKEHSVWVEFQLGLKKLFPCFLQNLFCKGLFTKQGWDLNTPDPQLTRPKFQPELKFLMQSPLNLFKQRKRKLSKYTNGCKWYEADLVMSWGRILYMRMWLGSLGLNSEEKNNYTDETCMY